MKEQILPEPSVCIQGSKAAATTFIAGVESIKNELALPIGSLTKKGSLRIGKSNII